MAATAGMAPRAEASPPVSAMVQRLISAAVLLPLAFGSAWLGGMYWAAVVLLFAIAMSWEWSTICSRQDGAPARLPPAGWLAMLAVAGSLAVAASGRDLPALAMLAAGAIATGGVAAAGKGGRSFWLGLGVVYVGLPSVAILWIRSQDNGLVTLAWILALVIAVDTGAYFAGRTIGGPKLAPRISPKKTWAGLAGGVVSASLVGWVTALLLELPQWLTLIAISGLLAFVEQAGDLAESAFKRRFAVKDSSRLIPGHGGVLDRVDGLLAVSLAVGLTEYCLGGMTIWTR